MNNKIICPNCKALTNKYESVCCYCAYILNAQDIKDFERIAKAKFFGK